MAKRQKHNYVDNKKFLAEMIEYRNICIQNIRRQKTRTYLEKLQRTLERMAETLMKRLNIMNGVKNI